MRDRAWGRRLTFSPKVFLPLTNLCRNRCDYCSFRRSPGEAGAWTMSPAEVEGWLARARREGCVEALFCLGDKPESAFGAYREELRGFGQESTVGYLHHAGKMALEHGLLPHTNAGILTAEDMALLKEVNVSLGLMLESISPRLCQPGMPHHKAPDKRPERRMKMIEEAGRLRIPFTTGILVGIGETRRERVESLLAIRRVAPRARAHPGGDRAELPVRAPTSPWPARPSRRATTSPHAVAMARLVLDEEVSVQAPAQPERRGGRRAPDLGRHQRLRRHLPRLPRLHQPPPPLAPRRSPRRRRAPPSASPSAHASPSTTAGSTCPGFLDPALRDPVRKAEERIAGGILAPSEKRDRKAQGTQGWKIMKISFPCAPCALAPLRFLFFHAAWSDAS